MPTQDLAYEALAEVTNTDWSVGRGELNAALRDIKKQQPGLEDTELANEIVHRAMLYRRLFDGATLTPNALAKHWLRVFEEQKRVNPTGTNLSTVITDCQTCDGHRYVLVYRRPAEQTFWMSQHGFGPNGEFEEYAPCPDCGSSINVAFSGHRPIPPDRVREMMAS